MHDFLKKIFDFWALTSFFKFESVDQPRYATLFCYPKPFLYKFRKFCKQSFREKKNKNTLTGSANFKKTTKHHVHLSVCAKSRKTNDAKSRKWPKTSILAIF